LSMPLPALVTPAFMAFMEPSPAMDLSLPKS
jgi:hypothetical protein